MSAPSFPFHPIGARICDSVMLLFAKLASLSEMINLSPETGVVFAVNPFISVVGVIAIGLRAPSNHICCDVVPVKYVSLPLASVINALFAVNPVLVPHAMLSLVLDSVLIDVVLPAMSVERASRATLIEPDIDPRVNI